MNIDEEKSYFNSLLKDLDEKNVDEELYDKSNLDFDFLMNKVDESKLVRKIFDWVQFVFTFTELTLIRELVKLLKFDLDEIQYHDWSYAGYKCFYELGKNIKIFICGQKNKDGDPVNLLMMSGTGCRDFEKRGGNYYDLFMFMIRHKAKASRIDSSHDVFTEKYFTMDTISFYADNHLFTPNRHVEFFGGSGKDGECSGKSYYIGRKTSDLFINIYDKLREREAKSDYDAIQSNVWIRIEVRAKKEFAERFVNEYCLIDNGDNEFISDFLYSVLDFKDADSNNKEVRQRPTAKWWSDFLNNTKKRKLRYDSVKTPDLKIKKNWLRTSVSHTLLCLFLAEGDNFFEYIRNLILEKGTDLDNSDIVMINEYLESLGYDDKLNMDDCKMKLRLLDNKKY